MPRFAGSVQGVVVQISTKTLRHQRRIDRRGIATQRKLHVNGRARVLVVFHFRFCERRLVLDAPVNRARAFVDVAALDEAREHARRLRFVVVRHREIRIVPLAENAETFEIPRLALERVFGVLAADAPESLDAQFALLFLFSSAFSTCCSMGSP